MAAGVTVTVMRGWRARRDGGEVMARAAAEVPSAFDRPRLPQTRLYTHFDSLLFNMLEEYLSS
jgi:hypothetical protein